MRAWRIHGYGGPEVMRFDEIALPSPGSGTVLVKILAASVNPIDWKIRKGLLARHFPIAFPRTLGRDCVGEADGALVMGIADPRGDGTHAEYALLPESQCAKVPASLDAVAAAGLGVAALSAYIPLAEIAQVKPGMRVLIHAGAGGVGSLAIQIAKHLGAHVTATASSSNREFCISLGAEEAADYQKEDFSMRGPFDVILDTIGGQTHLQSEKALKPGGLLVALAAAPIPEGARRSDVRVVMAQIQPTPARLEALLDWASKGVLRPQVTRKLPLGDAQEAYAILESGHGRGKLLLFP